MNNAELCNEFEKLTKEMVSTMRAKNHDYSKGDDPFKNLRRHGVYGIVVRMDDKLARLDTMTNPKYGEPVMQVKDESFDDTAKDIAVYSLLSILLRRASKKKKVDPLDPATWQTQCLCPSCARKEKSASTDTHAAPPGIHE